MLESYWDESGSGNDSPLVMAGFVADAEAWRDFSAECRQIAAFFHIPYFHTIKACNGRSNLYKHLSERQRMEMIGTVIHAVRECAVVGLFSFIDPPVYRKLTSPVFRSKAGSAYAMCLQGCLYALNEYFDSDESTEVSFFLESGHRNSNEAIRHLKSYKDSAEPADLREYDAVIRIEDGSPLNRMPVEIGDYGLMDKRKRRPLWAADLLAYSLHRRCAVPDEPFAESVLREIERNVPCYGVKWDADAINRLLPLVEQAEDEKSRQRHDMYLMRRYLGRFGIKAKTLPQGLVLDASQATEEQIEVFLDDAEERKDSIDD